MKEQDLEEIKSELKDLQRVNKNLETLCEFLKSQSNHFKHKCNGLEWNKHLLVGALVDQKVVFDDLGCGDGVADVLNAVRTFNNSRHWWERKIKIKKI